MLLAALLALVTLLASELLTALLTALAPLGTVLLTTLPALLALLATLRLLAHPLLALLRTVLLVTLLAAELVLVALLRTAVLALPVLPLPVLLVLVLVSPPPVPRLVLVVLSHGDHWACTPGCGGLAARASTSHSVAYTSKFVHNGSSENAGRGPGVGRS